MSRINILDSSVFNRIAAGEVVDRPASVVKELIENSIDSGAKTIDITVSDGGKYIRITDDGCGIEYDDIRTAFMPHATSKIKNIGDLDAISTLGFRGEALPSIASVAKVTLTSRRKEDETGGRIVIENGKILEETATGAPYGTTVIVSGLFANVPARLKFLRSDRSEEGEIISLVQRFILANYDTAISLTVNEKEIYRSEGKGLQEAAYSAIGVSVLKEYDYVHESAPGVEVYGYISKPAFSKHNRSYQTLIVNGRYVVNQEISFWIYNCCAHLLMKRQYPAYVIFINVPADMVDINVHPSKMEVKFIDIGRIKRLLSKAINDSLARASSEPKPIEKKDYREKAGDNDSIFFASDGNTGAGSIELRGEFPFAMTETSGKSKTDTAKSPVFPRTSSFASSERSYDTVRPAHKSSEFAEIRRENTPDTQFSILKEIISEPASKQHDGYEDISSHRYCGKLFNTYIMLESPDEVILIDQHAAHERLLYDELVRSVEEGKNTVQDLMFPYVFDVNYSDAELIDSHIDEIKTIGFELRRLSGNTYSLSSVPLILSDMDLSEFVPELIAQLERGKFGKLSFLKNALMQSACKAAIKGETDITDDDAKLLVKDICEKRIALFCPHGRPIAVRLKKSEIEKWFKRIV